MVKTSLFLVDLSYKTHVKPPWMVKNPINHGINHRPQLVIRISQPSTIAWWNIPQLAMLDSLRLPPGYN